MAHSIDWKKNSAACTR